MAPYVAYPTDQFTGYTYAPPSHFHDPTPDANTRGITGLLAGGARYGAQYHPHPLPIGVSRPAGDLRSDGHVLKQKSAAATRAASRGGAGYGMDHHRFKVDGNRELAKLEKYSQVYCNAKPLGSCMYKQHPGGLHCAMHSCMAVLADGSTCLNACPAGEKLCRYGYHRENGRMTLIQHSPTPSPPLKTSPLIELSPLFANNSPETYAQQLQLDFTHQASAPDYMQSEINYADTHDGGFGGCFPVGGYVQSSFERGRGGAPLGLRSSLADSGRQGSGDTDESDVGMNGGVCGLDFGYGRY